MSPKFLSFPAIQQIHEAQITAFGGKLGLRDAGLAESAVLQAVNDFYYARADIHGISAAYAYHIAQSQSFLDGNKRTGMAAALIFYRLNGIMTVPDWHELHDSMIAIAEKRLDKAGLAQRFRGLFGG